MKKISVPMLLFILVSIFTTACTVAPWERGNLAKPEMAIERSPLLNDMRAHNYEAREGSAIGKGSGSGGGCGCY